MPRDSTPCLTRRSSGALAAACDAPWLVACAAACSTAELASAAHAAAPSSPTPYSRRSPARSPHSSQPASHQIIPSRDALRRAHRVSPEFLRSLPGFLRSLLLIGRARALPPTFSAIFAYWFRRKNAGISSSSLSFAAVRSGSGAYPAKLGTFASGHCDPSPLDASPA